MRRTSLLVFCLALCAGAACSTVPVDPRPGEPDATLNFLGDPNVGNATQSLYARTNKTCGADLGLTTLGTHGMFWGNSKGPRPIATGAPLTLMGSTVFNVTRIPGYLRLVDCSSMGILTPKPGRHYEVVHLVGGLRNCQLKVTDVETGKEPEEYQPLPNCQ